MNEKHQSKKKLKLPLAPFKMVIASKGSSFLKYCVLDSCRVKLYICPTLSLEIKRDINDF